MSLKICIVGTAYPYKGGIAMFNERLARELISQGHVVDIITFTLQYPKFFFPGQSQFSNDPKPKDIIITRKVNSVNPISWVTTARKIKKGKYDIIISKYWIPAMGPSLGTIMRLARSKSTKGISIIDNIIPHEKRFGDSSLSNYFVQSVDGFVVMSKKVEQQMDQFVNQQPISYIPHPIYDTFGEIVPRDKALAHLGLDPQYDYVLFFGYIRDYKGLDILLDAIAEGLKTNVNLRLIVAGEYYSDSEKYLSQIDRLGITSQVILHTNFISNDEVKYFFCAADLVAQSYKSATQSGISQIAIYFEKPIVSTNVGGLPETVIHDKTGYLTNVDSNELAQAILRYFEKRPANRFRKEIQKLKELYSWNHFGSKLVELYDKINT
ncbi:MAG: glycosyltransferase [Saprospiraceae bacterium]